MSHPASAPEPRADGAAAAPSLSVVIATRSGWSSIPRTVACLAEQTIADRIELVLVAMGAEGAAAESPAVGAAPEAAAGAESPAVGAAPEAAAGAESPAAGAAPEAAAALWGHRVLAAPHARSVADANAAGARVAQADVVAFGEDHAFPLPGWAEALVARHREPWAVVGPVVRNANPGTLVSWADYALGYGAYAEGHPGGEVATAPGHNSSYKRAVLERHDDALEIALEAEWVFHLRLREEGERVCLEPRAVIRHVNFGMLRPFLAVTRRHGRIAAAARASAWPRPRQLVYALGSPLIPAVRLARIVRALPPEQRARFPKRAYVPLLAGLALDAAGQAAGFLRPSTPEDRAALSTLELERVRFVPAAEVAALP